MASFIVSVVLLFGTQAWALLDHSTFRTAAECTACHKRSLPTHDLGTPRSMKEGLPLGPMGRMECMTCHDCSSGRCTLRKTPDQLCGVCHDCTKGMACVIGVAHLGSSSAIDAHLNACFTCHDGSIGKQVTVKGSHKVNTLYVRRQGFNNLTDERVVLIGGRVTCVSCHNPYTDERTRLVKSNEGSRLCLTCHRR